ncbi:MAG: bi-domain-containing oxidoreductase [Verrucomicrobia bacterium]|nr:bi-domain-containing oxidoreductase [Verrucomicrobiota bacterium]
MKQILQSLKTGATEIADVPVPRVTQGSLLIQTSHTLISAGTERMLVDFGKAGWIKKARQQPDKVKMVLDKIKTDGLKPTLDTVFNKLDQPLPVGYCNVGVVYQVGGGISGFKAGDRVISNGKHAEAVAVPVNLCAKVPDAVSDEEAAFTVLGAIALQGIRLVKPTLGETIVVTGLGLVGLMTVQLLRANGCRVLGIDFDKEKLQMAKNFGAEVVDLSAGQDPLKISNLYSRDRGVDAVIVTAATKSSKPIHQAALMCRKRGRIVLVGVTGLELSRDDFFKKELTFQVSASYGPGRYDPNYEEKGQDYPVGFVRWTEQRNFEAVLDIMAAGSLDVKPLISHRFSIDDAENAYELISGDSPSLGILLEYPGLKITKESRSVNFKSYPSNSDSTKESGVSFIGSGNYATSSLMPAFKKSGAKLINVASANGVSGMHAGRKFGFEKTTTDNDSIFQDTQTDAIIITTRHNSHADLVIKALDSGKHVYVEKPLCLKQKELIEIKAAYDKSKNKPIIMVGFNRRFSPQIQKVKKLLLGTSGPKSFIFNINAGHIDENHWTQDNDVGGGRVVGEACHFIDLLRFLADSPILDWNQNSMNSNSKDTLSIGLKFEDGSIGTINYFANGPKSLPKERLEIFSQGRVLQLDNFRKLKGFSWPGFSKMNLWKQDKGQNECASAFLNAIKGKTTAPIPIEEIFEIAKVSIEIATNQR